MQRPQSDVLPKCALSAHAFGMSRHFSGTAVPYLPPLPAVSVHARTADHHDLSIHDVFRWTKKCVHRRGCRATAQHLRDSRTAVGFDRQFVHQRDFATAQQLCRAKRAAGSERGTLPRRPDYFAVYPNYNFLKLGCKGTKSQRQARQEAEPVFPLVLALTGIRPHKSTRRFPLC